MSDSSRDCLKREQEAEALDIYEQIKKQTEELSTSDGSIQFLKNLSNPTNLTNPQIIGLKRNINKPKDIHIIKNSKDNIKNKNHFHKINSHRNIRKEFLFSYENNKKYEEKSIKDEQKSKENKRKNFDIFRNTTQNKTLSTNKVILEPIWNKLQVATTFHMNRKDVRLDVRKNTNKLNYIENNKEISALKFNIKNKLERFEKLKRIKYSELSVFEKLMESYEKTKNYIENNYYNNYISYIIYLNRNIEKEKNIITEFIKDKYKLKNEIKRLNNMINKLIGKKKNFFLWISLQIKIKEKIINIPEYYFHILEEDDYYKIYNNKQINKIHNKRDSNITNFSSSSNIETKNEKENETKNIISINEKDRKRIINYKHNTLYNTVDEFLEQYDELEKSSINNLNKYQTLVNEINLLKKEYISLKGFCNKDEQKEITQKITNVKNINRELKLELKKLKIKKLLSPYKNNKKMNHSKSSFSPMNINKFNNEIIYRNHFNISKNLSPEKNNYNITSLSTFFNFSNKNLFIIIMDLFNMIKQNNFIKFHNFEKQYKKNDNQLLIIMNYIEKVVNLLIEEKNYYQGNPNLKQKYENIKAIVIKENKKLKFLNLLKMEEFKQKEKIKKIEKRMNKEVYLPTRQIDYSFMNRTNRYNKKIGIKDLKREDQNYQPSFEDFMFDL